MVSLRGACVLVLVLLCLLSQARGESAWNRIPQHTNTTALHPPTTLAPIYHSSALSIADGRGPAIVVLHGLTSPAGAQSDDIAISVDGADTFKHITHATPFKRYGHVAIATRIEPTKRTAGPVSYLVTVLGGMDASGHAAGDVHRSTAALASWQTMGGNYPPRYHHGGAVYNNGRTILVFGGIDASTGKTLRDTFYSINGGVTFIQRRYQDGSGDAPWPARCGMAFATVGHASQPTIVLIGGSVDAAGTAFLSDVWFSSDDAQTWTHAPQTATNLARGWAAAVHVTSLGEIVLSGGLTDGRTVSGETFVASEDSLVFIQRTLADSTYTPRYGHSLVAAPRSLDPSSEMFVYSIGGLDSSSTPTNDVFIFHPTAPGLPPATYTYEFVKYLPLCYASLDYDSDCSVGAPVPNTGFLLAQYRCVVRVTVDGGRPRTFLQPLDNGRLNTDDLCRQQSTPPIKRDPTGIASMPRCTLPSCWSLEATATSSTFCSVNNFPNACSNEVEFGQLDTSRTFTRKYTCRDRQGIIDRGAKNAVILAFPFRVERPDGVVSYIVNPASACAELPTPTGPRVDTDVPCQVESCVREKPAEPTFTIQPAPIEKQLLTPTNCRINSMGQTRCVAPGIQESGFYEIIFLCIETSPPIGSDPRVMPLNAPECAGQSLPSQLDFQTDEYACEQIVTCQTTQWTHAGFGQCMRTNEAGAKQYCDDRVGLNSLSAPLVAYQYPRYQCHRDGLVVPDSVCTSLGLSLSSAEVRAPVSCRLHACVRGAVYQPRGIGACQDRDSGATCCTPNKNTTDTEQEEETKQTQIPCDKATKMQAPTIYECIFDGVAYPGQCIDPYPPGVAMESCLLPTCPVHADPSFIGFRGQRYDVHTESGEVYNLISSDTIQYNAMFVLLDSKPTVTCNRTRSQPWTHPGMYLGRVGLQIGSDHVEIVPGDCRRGIDSITINGTPLRPDSIYRFPTSNSKHRQLLSYTDSHTLHLALHELDIVLQSSDHFFTQQVSLTLQGQRTNQMHGLLGQTWSTKTYTNERGHKQLIQGRTEDYIIAGRDLFGTDFKFNRFEAQ